MKVYILWHIYELHDDYGPHDEEKLIGIFSTREKAAEAIDVFCKSFLEKVADIFGECCISKLEKCASPWSDRCHSMEADILG